MVSNVLNIRLGIVDSVNYEANTIDITWLDSASGSRQNIPISHPYVGRGWGVRVGVEPGTIVAVGFGQGEKPFIVGYWENTVFETSTPESEPEIREDEFPFRKIKSGEIVLQSKLDSVVALNELGDILLETADGNIIEIDNETDTIFQKSAQSRVITEAGETTFGMVKRDRRTDAEREIDNIISTLTLFGSDLDLYSDIVGGDNLAEGSRFHPVDNRALNEYHMRLLEFADSCISADDLSTTESPKRDEFGFLLTRVAENKYTSENELLELIVGTKVDDQGRVVGFGSDEDFFEDRLLSTGERNLAIAFEVKFNSKNPKSRWLLGVNKEGVTRLHLPAGQDTDKKLYGVSLQCKTDGSIYINVGKEESTSNDTLTTLSREKSRKDRSITIDAEGNIELRIGGEQSLLIGTDGSVEVLAEKINLNKGNEKPVGTQACARENDRIVVPILTATDAKHPKLVQLALENVAELSKLASMFISPVGPCVFAPAGPIKLKGLIVEGSENVYVGSATYNGESS